MNNNLIKKNLKTKCYNWWLRSPGSDDSYTVGRVSYGGRVDCDGAGSNNRDGGVAATCLII